MGSLLHQVDVVGDVCPVQSNVPEEFIHSKLFELVFFLLQQRAVGGNGINGFGHSKNM